MADKNFKVKNNIIVNDVEIDPSSPVAEQILRYNGTKFIAANSGIPAGGLEGQILSKITDTAYNTQWIDNYADQVRVTCKNGTVSQINKGTAVMATGSAGDLIKIEPAVANGSVAVRFMLGVASENIPGDGTGYVTLVGPVKNINTNAYTVGTVLFIDPATPGGFTSTEPSAPNVDIPVAIVIKQSVSVGIIFVRMWSQGAKLGELQDVNVAGASNNQVLSYNSSTGVWSAQTVSGSGDTSASYVTLATSSALSNERVLTAGTGITVTDAGANNTVTIATSAILPTIFDNQGELIAASAADTAVRVPRSTTNGQVLTVNTSATPGMNWANLPASAPVDAVYITLSTNSTLTNERVLTAGAGITIFNDAPNSVVEISTNAEDDQNILASQIFN